LVTLLDESALCVLLRIDRFRMSSVTVLEAVGMSFISIASFELDVVDLRLLFGDNVDKERSNCFLKSHTKVRQPPAAMRTGYIWKATDN
jgi:hypothetical protein